LDWEGEDNVCIIRWETDDNYTLIDLKKSSVTDLTLENIVVKGGSYVGALGGYNISVSNCKIIGTSRIVGTGDYVGGSVGYNKLLFGEEFATFSDVSIGEYTEVYGRNYTGGIVGAYKEWWSATSTSSPLMDVINPGKN
jgi:hypothetical protein